MCHCSVNSANSGTTPDSTAHESKTLRGRTVSDLHLLSRRTHAHRYMDQIHAAARSADLFVFNGDIFDFHWSRFRERRQSLTWAEHWIRELIDQHAHCDFVFLLGNHDSLPAYRRVLDDLAAWRPNLRWHEDLFRVDGCLFLHGDAIHAADRPARLTAYRAAGNAKPRPRRVMEHLYDAFTLTRLHRAVPRIAPRKLIVDRLHRYLRTLLGPELDAIRHVYFGHVHTAFTDYAHRGLTFHNTGAAIRGELLRVLEFEARRTAD